MKKRIIGIILSLVIMVGILPIVASAYTATAYLKLDGQPASPSDLNGLPKPVRPDDIIIGMSKMEVDSGAYDLVENPKGTFISTLDINGTRLINLYGWVATHTRLSFNYLFSVDQFTVSESNPTLSINLFTVTYNPGTNGVGSVVKELAANGVNFTFRGATFTRTDYVQTGWATSYGGDKVYDLGGVKNNISAKTDLYPVWTLASYPVTINVKKDGGAWGAGAPNITFGTTSGTAVANGASVGNGTYNIYANSSDTGEDVTVSGSAASVDVNYYTVNFKSDDNTSTLDTQTVLSGQTAAYGGTPPTKTSTAQYSYAFSKWVTTAGGATEATLTNITAIKTVYASFTPTLLSYTITWKKDASNTIDTSTVAYSGTPTHTVPTNTGYTFAGWTPAIASVSGAATYTATWTLDTYLLNYILNGGTAGTPANPTSYTVESPNIALNNPTRTGYSFVGWSGTGLTGNTNTAVTIPTVSTGDRTYTANWKANTPVAPLDTIVTAKTDTSITINTLDGYEYSVDNGVHWYSGAAHSYKFTGLTANTEYHLICRKAVETTPGQLSAASEQSPALTVKTKSVGSVTAPTLVAVAYDPSKKLSDITLTSGWAWSAPETVPTVTNGGYAAVYTPTDTATVDYSGVAGYDSATGKITQTITLTVNRAMPTAADFNFTAPAPLSYDNTPKSAAVTAKGGISGMGAVVVKYYPGGVETPPKNVGTYTVKIDIAQGANYASTTAVTDSAWTFTITKVAQASLSISGEPASVTYGYTFNLSTTGGSGNGAVTWAVTSGSFETVDAYTVAVTITGVGETTITATKAADGNYSADVTDTYSFTPTKRPITVAAPTATGGWTKTYDGKADFDKAIITVGGITNKVGADVVNVSAQSAAYDTADVGDNKTLTIIYAIDGAASGCYLAPNNTVITPASITAATPTITLKNKTATYTSKLIEIDAATLKGVTGGTTPDGAITYTYYTKDTCADGDKTTVDKSGADAIGGAPKTGGTYYVKATIAASGNYTAATSTAVTLTIYYPSSGEDKSSAPVIVDGKTVDMGTSEVKDKTTTVTVDQNKMTEQLKSAKDSVVIPVTSKTDTAAAQLVVQNIEDMAKKGMTLTVQSGGVGYNLPAAAVDTAALLKGLEAADSSKVTFTVTMTELSKSSVTIKNGTLMLPPMEFTVTAAYSGKSVNVENFESYVQRDIELPSGVDPKTITTAVVLEANGAERHVPTEVYSKGGKWFAKVNSMTNSKYALIQNSVSFTDSTDKWYDAVVTEMASRKIINGVGENVFAGDLSITRAEFAAIIVRALGLPTNGTSTFADVATSAWYYGAVGTAFKYGIVSGVGDNRFDPEANITREEAMVMVTRAAKLCGMDTTGSGATGLAGFADAAQISSWAYDSAAFNVRSGLIKGSNGKIDSRADITRAETATVVLRLLQKAGLVDVRAIA